MAIDHDGENEYQYVLSVNGDAKKSRTIRTVLEHRSLPDVCEVYSLQASQNGLKGGCAFDLAVKRPDGKPWDFSVKADRDEAVRRVISEEPLFVNCSPPCALFSIFQNGNRHRLLSRFAGQA